MATLQCYYCRKIDIEHNRDGKNKITCIDCDKKQKRLKETKGSGGDLK